MLGLGLESLIPKRKSVPQTGQVAAPVPSNAFSPIGEQKEREARPFPEKPTEYVKLDYRREPRKLTDFRKHTHESVFQIEVEKIKPNPLQPRSDFNEEGLRELAQSIREFGIIQPIIVSKAVKEFEGGTDVEYQLIPGERRLMAAKLIGLERVPAIVKRVDEHRARLEMALVENVQRSDLNPMEAARGYAHLQDEFGLTQQEIAARVGKSREAVANTLRLLNLPLGIQEAIAQGKVGESQARTLLAVADLREQEKAFSTILAQKLTVRALEKKIRQPKVQDPERQYWERRLEEKLGTPVRISKTGSRGKVIVEFYSDEEWHSLVGKILGEENLE